MHEYILQEISSYNLRKPEEYNKYITKKFTMSDKLVIGKTIELDFGKDKLKVRLENIYKTNDAEKLFCLNTNKFVAIIKAIVKEQNQ